MLVCCQLAIYIFYDATIRLHKPNATIILKIVTNSKNDSEI